MAGIKTTFGYGGANLADSPGGEPTLATALRDAADDFAAVLAATPAGANLGTAGRVYWGGLVTDPTTASSQLTGAGGVTEWRVNVAAGAAQVNSVDANVAASADEVIHDTTNLLDAVGKACYAYVLLVESGGSVSISSVKGTAAVAASAVAPTDAEITTGVGHANWCKLALCYLERTGDTAVSQTQTNAGVGQAAAAPTIKTVKA